MFTHPRTPEEAAPIEPTRLDASGRKAGATHTDSRVLAIDAGRGFAMLFVGISHIGLYIQDDSAPLAYVLHWLGFFAAPNFLLLSGISCGYQLAVSPSRDTVTRIVDRGLFVLLVGHVLIAGSVMYNVPPGTAFEHIIITDTIGLVLCTTPFVAHLRVRQLLLGGAALFLLTALVGLTWHPTSPPAQLVGGLLLGLDSPIAHDPGLMSPTLAYFALFLAGIGIGRLICQYRSEGREAIIATRLLGVGLGAAAFALFANLVAYHMSEAFSLHLTHERWVNMLVNLSVIRHQRPPTPAYALCYGGIGVALVGLLLFASRQQLSAVVVGPVRAVAVLGRASFVSYVCIQWLIDFTPHGLGFSEALTPALALAYLGLVILVVFGVAWVWDAKRGNRLLTVGLKPGHGRPRSKPTRPASAPRWL